MLIGVLAAVVILIVPGAVFAWRALDGGGSQPHDVLPGDALGYVRLDLDPSASQKVDAMRFLRQFPALNMDDISDDVDLREWMIDQFAEGTGCDIDFTSDVEPWLGDRIGVAMLPPEEEEISAPGVVVALQVDDEDAADSTMQTVRECGGDAMGHAYLDGYMLIAESQEAADGYAEAAGESSLNDNDEFTAAMDQLGDQGVASAWFSGTALFESFGMFSSSAMSAESGQLSSSSYESSTPGEEGEFGEETPGEDPYGDPTGELDEELDDIQREFEEDIDDIEGEFGEDLGEDTGSDLGDDTGSELGDDLGDDFFEDDGSDLPGDDFPGGSLPTEEMQKLVEENFRSFAVTFRFNSDYAEIASVIHGDVYQDMGGDGVSADVPDSTALLLGSSNLGDSISDSWEELRESIPDPEGFDQMLEETGLSMPEDLATVLGTNLLVAVDGERLDLEALFGSDDFSTLDLGLKVDTDADAFADVWERLSAAAAEAGETSLEELPLTTTDDGYVIATNEEYAAALEEGGSLGDSDAYQSAIKDADSADAVLFVNFDAVKEAVLPMIAESGAGADVVDSLDLIEALGFSTQMHDGYAESTLRITVE